MVRTDTDNLWTKIESLQWILFVIFAIKMVGIPCFMEIYMLFVYQI
jgi:hypothetical protein